MVYIFGLYHCAVYILARFRGIIIELMLEIKSPKVPGQEQRQTLAGLYQKTFQKQHF